MGLFTEEQLEVAITKGIRAFHALKGIDVCFPTVDPLIVSEVTKQIVALIEKAAAEPDEDEPLLQGEALVGVSDAEFNLAVSIAAYELALKHPNAAWGMDYTHKIAAEIGVKLHQGFKPEENHIVQTLSIKIEPDTAAFRKAIDDIFGSVEWRREGWNDAKAVMLRKLNKQIKHPDDDSYILRNFPQAKLELVRKFIASFQFDPDHESPKKF